MIHTYLAETNVTANETTTVPVRFEAPGSLRVRWTINGTSAASTCAAVGGYGTELELRPVDPRPATARGGIACAAGMATVSNLQVGQARVSGRLFSRDSRLSTVMGEAEIVSGTTTTLTLAFEAPVRVDP